MQNGDDMVSLSATKHTMAAAEAGNKDGYC